MKKWDCILLVGAIGIALLWLCIRSIIGADGAYAVVSVDGIETVRYALTEDISEEIQGYENGEVHLVIHNGTADVTAASCPDQLCVHQARISRSGETIVCLPGRIVIRVVSDEEAPVDAVAR
jgi:hypothetical protein